jgi:phosphonate transport system ATP-binding protein
MLAEGERPSAAAQGGVLLEAKGVSFAYQQHAPVLTDIDITIRAGEIAMILGRSGCGKTTLLKVLKGLLRPQRGSVRFETTADGAPPASHTAYIPQTLGLVRNTSALENALTGTLARTSLGRSMIRSFPREAVEEAKETLSGLGLGAKIDKRVFDLSGGERQRVAIARALMQHPRLILADEFVSQLDHATAEEILESMRDIARGGVGMLVTTHEVDVVMNHSDRVLVIRDGRVIHDEPAQDLTQAGLIQLLR